MQKYFSIKEAIGFSAPSGIEKAVQQLLRTIKEFEERAELIYGSFNHINIETGEIGQYDSTKDPIKSKKQGEDNFFMLGAILHNVEAGVNYCISHIKTAADKIVFKKLIEPMQKAYSRWVKFTYALMKILEGDGIKNIFKEFRDIANRTLIDAMSQTGDLQKKIFDKDKDKGNTPPGGGQ